MASAQRHRAFPIEHLDRAPMEVVGTRLRLINADGSKLAEFRERANQMEGDAFL